MEQWTLTYTINENDFLDYNLSAPGSVRSRWISILLTMGFYLGAAALLAYSFPNWPTIIISYSIAALLSISTVFLHKERQIRSLREAIVSQGYEGQFGRYKLELSEQGIREYGPTTEEFVKWEDVVNVIQHRKHIYIILSTSEAAMIPQHSYSGSIDFDEIPGLVQVLKSGSAQPESEQSDERKPAEDQPERGA